MALQIYDSKSKKKHPFVPIDGNKVSMYVCGITPQNSPHLGHAVSAIRMSVVRRYLQYRGYNVIYVENITDIDDKIIARSVELGIPPGEIADKYSAEYREQLQRVGVPDPDHVPRVSGYIEKIIAYVQDLISRNHAYVVGNDVYFDIASLKSYGELSGRSREFAQSGHRIATSEGKHDEADFVLWKSDTQHGWESPWGVGRPGWHIECSAMSSDILGPRVDIHGGGLDLLFPHHENENAQCIAHNGHQFVNTWMHSGLLNINGTKMSKSLGNFITLFDAIDMYGAELINFVILRHQYRSAIDMTDRLFMDSLNALLVYVRMLQDNPGWESVTDDELNANATVADMNARFIDAMDDDIHTPRALVVLSPYAESIQSFDESERPVIAAGVKRLLAVLGLFVVSTADQALESMLKFHQKDRNEKITVSEIESILAQRAQARADKNYDESDRLREVLASHDIKCIDGKDKLSWEFIL